LFIHNKQAALEKQFSSIADVKESSTQSSSDVPSGQDAAERVLQAAVTSEAKLAAWLGIDEAAAKQLLQVRTVQTLRLDQWKARLNAATGLLEVLGHLSSSSSSSIQSSDELASISSGSPDAAVPAASREHISDSGSSSGSSSSSRRRRRSQSRSSVAAPAGTGSRAVVTSQCAAQQRSPQLLAALHSPQQQQQQRQLQQHVQMLDLPQPAAQALQRALDSGQSLAVAAVTVACFLAPFSRQLYQPPPRPPAAVVQIVLQHPAQFAKGSFESNCIALTSLAQASEPLRAELAELPLQQLVQYTCCSTTRLCYVQYLVQTQQPWPWEFNLHALLLSTWLTMPQLRERFCKAYPGFEKWEIAMQSL
jgi:hypothetical protein